MAPAASNPNDPTLIRAIVAAAQKTGANAALMVATAIQESGLRWRPTPGDNGTSFGPFQHHEGGALGSHPAAWASTTAAVDERARAFAAAGASTGAGAAAVQRPADRAGYATAVDALLPRARTLIAQATGGRQPTQTTAAVPTGQAVAAQVKTQIGVPYKWGGATPSTGFDCSGLVRWVIAKFGVNLPHNAAAQFQLGTPVAQDQLQPGDVVFFQDTDGPGITHNGIYVGNGQFVNAPHTGTDVRTADLTSGYYAQHYAGARRYVKGTTTTTVSPGGTAKGPTTGGGIPIPGAPVSIPVPSVPDPADAVSGVAAAIAGAPAALATAATSAAEDVGAWSLSNVILPGVFVLGGLGLALYGLSRAFGGGQQGSSSRGGAPPIIVNRVGGGGGAGAALEGAAAV